MFSFQSIMYFSLFGYCVVVLHLLLLLLLYCYCIVIILLLNMLLYINVYNKYHIQITNIIQQLVSEMLSQLKLQDTSIRQNIISQTNIANSLANISNTSNSHYNKLSSTYQYPTQRKFISIATAHQSQAKFRNQYQNFGSGYQFSVFDISNIKNYKTEEKEQQYSYCYAQPIVVNKPQPFMGAFMQTQMEFNFFDLNIKIPSLKEVQPFSRILTQSTYRPHPQDEKKQQVKLQSKQEQKKRQKLLSESLFGFGDNYSEHESQIVEVEDVRQEEAQLQNLQISKIQQKEQQPSIIQNQSLFHNYDDETEERKHRKRMRQVLWDEPEVGTGDTYNHSYQFYRPNTQQFINKIQSQLVLSQPIRKYTNDQVCSGLAKMIMGVESSLFTLDYHTLSWSFNNSPAQFQHTLRTSFKDQLQDIFIIANYKSRLQSALNYIKKQSYRRILQQVAMSVKQFMIIVQEIVLQVVARKGSLLDFIITLTQIKSEIILIYELIINQSFVTTENKSYMDFDNSFLNSQAVMFKQIIRLSNSNDSLIGKGYQLSLKLLRAAFKPITFTLNRIVFQQAVEISNKDDTYLRYYFQNLKDLLSYLGKRIQLIKNQSNELYMICRIKEDINIVMETNQLQQYTHKWKALFNNKRKMIQDVQKRQKKRVKELKLKKQEEKIKQIYQLRARLLKRIQQTKQRKSQIYLEGVKEIERLKKDILERQEKRRLKYLIQKQQQKGFLLDAELKEKSKLILQKDQLLQWAFKEGLKIANQIQLKKQKSTQRKNSMKQQKIQGNLLEPQLQKKTSKKQGQIIRHESQSSQYQLKNDKQMRKKESTESVVKNEQSQSQMPSGQLMVQRTNSNFSIPSEPQIEGESQNEQDDRQSIKLQQQQLNANQPQKQDIHVSTNTVLQLCIDNIIRQQIDITHQALSYLVYDQYQLFNIMQFLRKILLTGNGQAITNFLHLSTTHDSKINIQYFNQCSLFDYGDQFIRSLSPQFYQDHHPPIRQNQNQIRRGGSSGIYNNRQINLFHDNLELIIGFQFAKLPAILQPYFSYIHLSKYMQIFAHILKIRHCTNLISSCLLTLNQHKLQFVNEVDKKFISKLYQTRHIIHMYLNTLQSFLFYRVIQKEMKTIKTKLKNKDINELAVVHLNMLDFIIRRGLIDNPLNQISKKIRALLMEIRKFKNIVDSFCANDIHSYLRDQIQGQVNKINMVFREQHNFLQSLFYHP